MKRWQIQRLLFGSQELTHALDTGWEPFAVVMTAHYANQDTYVFIRKPTEAR